ncbi:hypothetical protein HYFRA_00012201 [Hymenoscyphus fraxineus]|uniref:2Fe-2S ferredoxin-type domain-containing protein n=1 Tax=Hymenoscyphus fraxineus TaxID=746836 RepID=A0A9N9L1P6_9HELO|nr:hypothetical protein HYFRA_00012201 [Hymenoscyphus fraxineus]
MFAIRNSKSFIAQAIARRAPTNLINLSTRASIAAATRSVSFKAHTLPRQIPNNTAYNAHVPAVVRSFSATSATKHTHLAPPPKGEEVYITFVKDGDEDFKVPCAVGDNILHIAQTHDVEMEGACEGSCACSTCHIIIEDEKMYDKIPEADDDENDMLDLAFGLKETSRLGCQIVMTRELDGLRVKLPNATRNMQAQNFK